jgi:hypothetical protein
VVFNFEDQVRTCCGQGRSDAECNFHCIEPIANDSTIESQYITDLTFPLGMLGQRQRRHSRHPGHDADLHGLGRRRRQLLRLGRRESAANQNPNSYVSPAGYTAYGLTNANGLTLNTIVDVQYSVDGGPLQPATAGDGEFDGCSEAFSFAASGSTIGVVVTNSVGNTGTCQIAGGGICDGNF